MQGVVRTKEPRFELRPRVQGRSQGTEFQAQLPSLKALSCVFKILLTVCVLR